MNFQFNLIKNMELPDFKKGCLKIQYRAWITAKYYDECFMCASTALQTSLKHTLSEEMHEHISL